MPDGRIVVDGALTRSGVFVYRQPDGTERREYRPAEQVFKADSLDSFLGAPVTDDHPPELLTADNARAHAVGAVCETPRADGNYVVARLSVFDAATIAKMKVGKVQLSCGYDVDLVETPGTTPNGERYDAVQTNIRGNHVAIVDSARAGNAAHVRMDAAGWMLGAPQENGMDEALKKALADLVAATARADAADARVKQLEANVAEQTARADAADKARTDSGAAQPEMVRARVALERTAAPILSDLKPEALALLSDRAVQIAVVKKVDNDDLAPEAKAGDIRSQDAYVLARFDAAVKRSAPGTDIEAQVRAGLLARVDSTGQVASTDEVAAAKKSRERADAEYQKFAARDDRPGRS